MKDPITALGSLPHIPTSLTALVLTTKCKLQGERQSLATLDSDGRTDGNSGPLQVVPLHFLGPDGWKKEESSSARVGHE